MIITKLQFEGFRNLDDGEILPDSGVNVIFGTNAQGKTNLLEGIWLLSGNKSFRGSRDSELIKFGRDYARLKIEFFAEDRVQNAEILFLKGKKEVKINGVKKDIWDYRLAVLGANVTRMRINYVERLSESAKIYHMGISESMEDLDINYSCITPREYCSSGMQIRDYLSEKIREKRTEDLKDGYTSIGPHRDDLEILINGENVRTFGSQGQQRSCVLSMKIAEAELIKIATSQEPVVLLDDVLSELDSKRQEFLLNKIFDRQVFISCCEAASVERLKGGRLFEVKKGVVKNYYTQNLKDLAF